MAILNTPASKTYTTKVEFASVEEFKSHIGTTILDVVRNPKTNKLFMSTGSKSYKVQQNIDLALPLRILIPETGIDDACLINASGGAEVLGTL